MEPQTGTPSFELVVAAVREFCPQIETIRPGICALSAHGPARYFGGEAELARKVAETVAGHGFDCRVGIADGLFAALLAKVAGAGSSAAKFTGSGSPAADVAGTRLEVAGDHQTGASTLGTNVLPVMIVPPGESAAFLSSHPVAVLGQPELTEVLSRLGVWTLGEFASLTESEAENRFGAQGLIAHRLARGLDPRPLAAELPPADLSVQVEFDPPARQAEPVVFAAKSLASTMHARLAAGGLVCVRVRIQVICEDGREITRSWRHDGLLSELAVAERVRWQLDGWRPAAAAVDTEDTAADRADGSGENGSPARRGSDPDTDSDSEPESGIIESGGVILLRLIPDQPIPDQGRQLGLWGDAPVTDRVARAAVRVQAMLGHGAVRQPVLAGGRGPADEALCVPFGDAQVPRLPPDRPWPGRIPAPAPTTVYQVPRPARVTNGTGGLVTVTGRGQPSSDPAKLSTADGESLAITAWAGPWPVNERWWDPVHACRKARFQLVTEDGSAWLAVVKDGRWLIEASYD